MFIPLDENEFNRSLEGAISAKQETEFDPKAEERGEAARPRRDKDGVPTWTIRCSYAHERDFEPEFVEVRVSSPTDPGVRMGPIVFGGLEMRTWNMGSKRGWSYTAKTWTQEPKPSTKRAEPPAPPSPSAAKGS